MLGKVGVMPLDPTKRWPGLRERAVRMVAEIRGEDESEWAAAMGRVAELIGVGTPGTVRKWVRQGQVDARARVGTSTEESAEVKRLRWEDVELKRARRS